tara:strand:+ start:48006 stop:48290 length:285 start_codon:yes stop_codon:yes gene_type:complete
MYSTYLRPVEEIHAECLDEHVDYLQKLIDEDVLFYGGRRDTHEGGVYIASADSKEAFEDIIQGDPFYKTGSIKYEIIAFDGHMVHPDIAKYLQE